MSSLTDFKFQKLAVPTVVLLISFLAYSSQALFLRLDPAPLAKSELLKFNTVVSCIWICYYRACTTDPGHVRRHVDDDINSSITRREDSDKGVLQDAVARNRWCRKCDCSKPPRAHHCKTCGRCIPKMDHHCPWTNNCVSHFTLPHFIRFLIYCVLSMTLLQYFLFIRCAILWEKRAMPSYLGPSVFQLLHLFVLVCTNSLTLFMLFVMLVRTLWGLGGNVTTIESWEIARHERLLRRSRVFGGYLYGPDGIKIRIEKQEFPYDIGIWSNIVQGMGTANPLAWFWPLARTPLTSGVHFEVNGFDERSSEWPPPDPDRIPRAAHNVDQSQGFMFGQSESSGIEEFKERQARDFERQDQTRSTISRRKPFNERYANAETQVQGSDYTVRDDESPHDSGEEGWASPEGDRLRDFGVDEDVEFYDQDDIPLAELLRRRKLKQ